MSDKILSDTVSEYLECIRQDMLKRFRSPGASAAIRSASDPRAAKDESGRYYWKGDVTIPERNYPTSLNPLRDAMEISQRRREGFKPTMTTLKENCWKNAGPCVLVGGGPSARGFNFTWLWNRINWLAVNLSGIVPNRPEVKPAIRYVCDERAIRLIETEHADHWKACRASRRLLWYGIKDLKYDHECEHVGVAGGGEWGLGPRYVGQGGCGGFHALNIIDGLGGSPIFILGYDLKGRGGKMAWGHDHYPADFVQEEVVYEGYLKAFRDIVPQRVKDKCIVVGDSRLGEAGFESRITLEQFENIVGYWI